MASSGSKRRDQNGVVYSSKIEETTSINNHLSVVPSKHLRVSTTLPSDVIPEILCRLPVKFILRFQCVCKWWDSLISDPKFVKKQLHVSTTRNVHFLLYDHIRYLGKYILTSDPIDSIFTNITSNITSRFEYSPNGFNGDYPWSNLHDFVGSCNGILCIADYYKGLVILWNPSIRKFKEFPLLKKPNMFTHISMTSGFGYNSSKDNYKVVVVFVSVKQLAIKTEVEVHSLGTNFWRRSIQEHPLGGVPVERPGKFVSGTINWLFSKESGRVCPCFIVSFNLANESYQKILPPNFGGADVCDLSALGVLRDCLCVTSGNDIWIMNEYAKQESWTKLFTIPYKPELTNSHVRAKAVYIFEDGQVLLKFIGGVDECLILYDIKRGTLKSTDFRKVPEICVESLISPCSFARM